MVDHAKIDAVLTTPSTERPRLGADLHDEQ